MNIIKKIIWVVIGSVIAAFGIDLAIYAGFGGATLAVLWQGVSYVLHITLGQASFVVAVGMIVFCMFLGGKFGMCTICTILLSGVMIQKTLHLLHAMIENKA